MPILKKKKNPQINNLTFHIKKVVREDKVRQSPKIRGKITKKNENFMSG